VALTPLWKADRPGPEDFLEQLRDPVQLKLVKAHTELQWRSYALGPHLVAAAEFTRRPWSIESMAAALGISAAGVQGTLDSVRRQIHAAERRASKQGKRKARKSK
jgi:hypothetical protein